MKTYSQLVFYFDLFSEHDDFFSTVFRSSKGKPLHIRLLLSGVAGHYERKNGPVEKNHIYTLTIKLPRYFWLLRKVRYNLKESL